MGLLRACLLLALAAVCAPTGADTGAPHPIQHVFVIVLENQGYEATFGPRSEAPYLARTLPQRGVLLTQYFATGHYSLDNYLAMISGQAASPETRDDCETFTEFVSSGTTADGQAIGRGCVYPSSVKTLPDQLAAVHKTWRGYMEDMGNDPSREAATCGHPALGAADPTQAAEGPSARVPAGDQYAVRHNPFVYFHSIIDSPACAANVVNLEHLRSDLAARSTTPNFAFISPNLCHDGHDAPCKNGEPGGLQSADAFLQRWVPLIMSSPAFRHAGLLVITFDEGDAEVVPNPAGGKLMTYAGERCCNQQPGPNLAPFPQTERDGEWTVQFRDFGGERVGAVLLSPLLKGGGVSRTPFNHYSLLRTFEDLLGTNGHLGYAGQTGLAGFFEPAASDLPALRRPAR
jgi:phosphatidylinositol-3-phosphatase